MKVLSWNILHGGGSRVVDIVNTVENHNADVLCLQEFRHGKTKTRLIEGLAKIGYTHNYAPEAEKPITNTVAIFSKQPVSGVCHYRDDKGAVRCIEATLEHSNRRIVTVGFPHKKAQIPLFELLLEFDKTYLDQETMIIGDFNCGIPFEDSETKTFYATHLFQQMLRQGWVDSWRSRQEKTREYTWYSTQKNNGFRYDHCLCSPTLDAGVVAIEYDHAAREQGVSDHSVLIVEL